MVNEIFSITFAMVRVVVMITINKYAGNILGECSLIDINCTQTSSSVHSPALLFRSTSAFFKTMFEKRLPIPLMAVMANMTLRLPSMFVLRIRKMCWNFSGMTKDWKTRCIDQKIVFVEWRKWRRSRQMKRRRPTESPKISKDGHFTWNSSSTVCHFVRFTRRFEQIKIEKPKKFKTHHLHNVVFNEETRTYENESNQKSVVRWRHNDTGGLDAIGGGSSYRVCSTQRCQRNHYLAGLSCQTFILPSSTNITYYCL